MNAMNAVARLRKLAITTLALVVAAQPAFAVVPQRILYQGTLRRAGALHTGNATFLFRITSADGLVEYWNSGSTVAYVSAGLFRYPLGVDNPATGPNEATAFVGIDWSNVSPYVEVTVDGALLTPREEIHSVPYAIFNSNATDAVNPRVMRSGDAMTGSLTLYGSTLTITGNALSVGLSTFVVAGGLVGIGTASPGARLAVSDPTGTTLLSGSQILASGSGASSGVIGVDRAVASAVSVYRVKSLAGDKWRWGLEASNDDWHIVDEVNSLDRMTITQAGNAGIGYTAPQGRLEVRPAAANAYSLFVSSQNGAEILSVDKLGDVRVGAHGHAFASGDLSADPDLLVSGNVVIDGRFISHNNSGSSVTFTSAGEFVVGTSSFSVVQGRTGIGTSSPDAPLDIEKAAPDAFFTETIRLTNPSSTASGRNTIDWFNAAGNMKSARIYSQVGAAYNASKFFIDVANTSQVLQQRLTIDEDGDVGIGTTNPSSPLEVNGVLRVTRAQGANDLTINPQSAGEPVYWHQLGATQSFGVRSNGVFQLGPGGLVSNGAEISLSPSGFPAQINRGGFHIEFSDSSNQFVFQSGHSAEAASRSAFVFNAQNALATSNIFELREAGAAVMTVNPAGNVGIGTTSPGATRLRVQGSSASDFHLRVSSANGSTELMVVASSGAVGIGTSAPQARLHVSGNAFIDTSGASPQDRHVTFKSGGSQFGWGAYPGSYAPGLLLQGITGGGAESASHFLFMSALDDNQPAARLSTTKDLEVYTAATAAGLPGNLTLRIGSGARNVYLGDSAGTAGGTASSNTFVGSGAGFTNATGNADTFIGRAAGFRNTASSNTFVGSEAGYQNTSGAPNVFLGASAGASNTTGAGNVFIGPQAGYTNTTGSNQLIIDNDSLGPPLVFGDFSTGNLGIGTSSPGTSRLWVQGVEANDFHLRVSSQNGTTPILAVDKAGRVGIGTSSPDFKLVVSAEGQSLQGMRVQGGLAGNDIMYWQKGNGTYVGIVQEDGDWGIGANAAQGRLEVRPAVENNFTMWISSQNGTGVTVVDKAGNVGIGTTNPGAKLEVAGGFRVGTTAQTGSANRFRMLQAMVRVTKSANQTLANNTLTAVTWDEEGFDTDTLHDNVTNNSRLTATVAGKYLVGATLVYLENTTGGRGVHVRKNGTTYYGGNEPQTPAAGGSFHDGFSHTTLVDLAAGDYVEIIGHQQSGGNLDILASATNPGSQAWMSYVGE